MINLDYLTLSTVIGVLSIITVIILAILMKTNTDEKGIEMWLYGAILSVVGFLALFFKPVIHVYSTFINNTCALTAVLLILEGVLRFRGIGNKEKREGSIWYAVVFFIIISFINKTHAATRYLFYDMLMIIMFIAIAYFFIRGIQGVERKLSYLYVASFMVFAIGFAYRWILALFGTFGDAVIPNHPSTMLLFFLTIIWLTLYLYSLLLIINYRSQIRLVRLSDTDALTGLFNRRKLDGGIEGAIESSKVSHRAYVLLLLDINGFKNVNDTYGHIFGDYLLVELANKIKSHTRKGDFTARYGGDEFIVILDMSKDDIAVDVGIDRLRRHIEEPFNYEGYSVSLKIAMGSVVIDEESVSVEEVLFKADSSMYEEKSKNHTLTKVDQI